MKKNYIYNFINIFLVNIKISVIINLLRNWYLRGENMERMQCDCCGHVYDKDEGDAKNNVPAGTAWKDVPADYKCPECGSGKDTFIIE